MVEKALPPAAKMTLAGLKVALGDCPLAGETLEDMLTVPEKPLALVSVIVTFWEALCVITILDGLGEIVNPTTRTVMLKEWISGPLEPIIETV